MSTKWTSKPGYNVALREKRIGETNISTCGLKMTIIDYKSASNVDILFEDGTIIKGKNYAAFKAGNIANPKKRTNKHRKYASRKSRDRVGETNIAKNGLRMTIIEYRQAVDLDIQFEDGVIVKHKTYRRFKDGSIKHPIARVRTPKGIKHPDRVGEIGVSKDGEEIKIVAYRLSNDIDVQFPDGYIRTGMNYCRFKSGKIQKYDRKLADEEQRKQRLGETVTARNGLKATIIRYHRSSDLDIQFEDGVVVKGTTYANFKKGVIKHPDINPHLGRKIPRQLHLGETVITKDGLKATLIEYKDTTHVTVELEDGTVLENRRYYDFKRGNIKSVCKNRLGTIENYKKKRIGEVGYNRLGLKITIVEYNRSNDITVQFEDGQLVGHKTYEHFKLGWVPHPTIKNRDDLRASNMSYYVDLIPKVKAKDRKSIKQKDNQGRGKLNSYADRRLGTTSTSREGYPIKIIAYRGSADIDVQFEDGFIIKSTTYDRFIHNNIVRNTRNRRSTKQYIGTTAIANCGMKMTCIAYRKHSDIDVQFEDGTVVEHRNYKDFKQGMIKNPSIPRAKGKHEGVHDVTNPAYLNARDRHLGEVTVAKCGLKVEIIEYFGVNNITVQFEDGIILEGINYGQFRTGALKHPNFSKRSDFYALQRLGELVEDEYGYTGKIVGYRNYTDIDVQYNDGKLVEHTTYKKFNKVEQPAVNSTCI